jgi:hypothetical protein
VLPSALAASLAGAQPVAAFPYKNCFYKTLLF